MSRAGSWSALENSAARILELDKVLALVAEHALTLPGRQALLALHPASPEALAGLRVSLKETAACMVLVRECGPAPLSGIADLSPFLEKIRFPESWLSPRELLVVAATFAGLERVGAYRQQVSERVAGLFQPLAEAFDGIESFAPLSRLLESCIGGDEEILDGASLELEEIRRRIASTRQQIDSRLHAVLGDPELQSYIQDHLVTIRNQRYVLPLRTNFRGAIPGIIHDHSRSRQTFFVEPLESVSLNNHLALLLQDEKQEELNILRRIADRLRQAAPAVRLTLEKIFALDQLQAKALFGARIRAEAPELTATRGAGFSLRQARHPLLAATLPAARVVPVDIDFPATRYGLVISGANTGGKTVTLKTAGLIILMARCGLLLPVAADSRVPLFSQVLAAIGDGQDLSASLSTFSGHLLAVKAILEKADADSLVLLDELGVGTDPKEGAALAQAILHELKSRRTTFMVTTHYNDVKSYAYEEEGVSSVAVAFDPATMKPLYHLQYGVPGLSNALLIARNLGFSPGLIERARELVGESESRTATLAARLEKRLAHSERHEKELLALKQQARIAGQRQARLAAELEAEKEKIANQAREQVAALVREARQKFKVRLAELEAAKIDYETARQKLSSAAVVAPPPEISLGRWRGAFNQTRAEVEQLLPAVERERAEIDWSKLGVGARVMVAGQVKPAQVLALEKSGQRITVLLEGNLRVTLSPERILRHLPGPAPVTAVKISRAAGDLAEDQPGKARLGAAGVGRVLNLVGKRVEEAAELLPSFIDQAVLAGETQVEIIHGHGTGRLRQGVWEILLGLPWVGKCFHPEAAAGGAAITVVELKG